MIDLSNLWYIDMFVCVWESMFLNGYLRVFNFVCVIGVRNLLE